jgi:ferric-dicitrate binding protein FerR (iron transport regulator)
MSELEKARREEEEVRRLLEDAGPRPSIPEDDLAAITEAARAVWHQRYGGRKAPARGRRWWIGLAAAAALAVALGLAWWLRTLDPPPAAPQVASIEVLTGTVRMWKPDGEGPVPLPPGALGRLLPAGTELETGGEGGEAGRLAVRMAGGSVRLDAGTRIRLSAVKLIDLEQGAVYIDSGGAPGGMAVQAPNGFFQSIGTQFEVRIERNGTRLRVREGHVALQSGNPPVVSGAGEELIVRANGRIARRQTAVYGPEWDWVLQAAPRLDIEGLKVRAFLDWLAREEGRRIEFADDEAAALADSTVLHGSIEHLNLAEAPGVVLASCGLGHRVSEGRMVVFVASR